MDMNYVFATYWFFIMIIFDDKKHEIIIKIIITSVSLRHYVSSKIFVEYVFLFLLICFGDGSSPRRYSVKNMFLKIPQISQENTCVR